jgi:hypothetical protein
MIVCAKKDWDNFLKELHPFYQAFMNEFHLNESKFMGENVVYTHLSISSEDSSEINYKGELPEDFENYGTKDEPIYDDRQIMSSILNQLQKFTPNVIVD